MTDRPVRFPGQSPSFPGGVRAGNLIFTSGIVASSALARFGAESTTEVVDFEVQAEEALATLIAVVDGLGGSVDTVVKVEAFLSEARYFAAWNVAFGRIWPNPGPARITVVTGFVTDAVDIEVQAVAMAQ